MSTPQNLPNPAESHIARFRIVRGARAVGTDGPFGTVQQIVVDHDSGVLRALIIRSDENGREFELPASYVRQTTGSEVHFDLARAELAAHPDLTTPYDPEHYVPLYEGVRLPTSTAGEASMLSDRPIVTRIENDAAELVTADPTQAETGQRLNLFSHQPGGPTAPVYDDRAENIIAARSAEGFSPAVAQPATPSAPEQPTAPRMPATGAIPPLPREAPTPPAPVVEHQPLVSESVTAPSSGPTAAAVMPPRPLVEPELPAPPSAEVAGPQRRLAPAPRSTSSNSQPNIPLVALIAALGVVIMGILLLKRRNGRQRKAQALRDAQSERDRRAAQERLRAQMAERARVLLEQDRVRELRQLARMGR